VAAHGKRVTNHRRFSACWKRNVLIRRGKNNRSRRWNLGSTQKMKMQQQVLRCAQDDKSDWGGGLFLLSAVSKKEGPTWGVRSAPKNIDPFAWDSGL
jgi:hypothetical protein